MDVSSSDDPIRAERRMVQSLLDNEVTRNLFYDWVSTQKKLAGRTATGQFLEECIIHKLVPDTFRVDIYWRGSSSIELKHRWHLSELEASLKLMELAREGIQLEIKYLYEKGINIYRALKADLATGGLEYLEEHFCNLIGSYINMLYRRNQKRIRKLLYRVMEPVHQKMGSGNQLSKIKRRNHMEFCPHDEDFGDVVKPKKNKKRRFRRIEKSKKLPDIKNYSSLQFDNNVKSLLSKGRTFIPNAKYNKTDLLVSMLNMERKMRIKFHHYKLDKEAGCENFKDEPHVYPIPLPPINVRMDSLRLPPKPLMEFVHGVKAAINTNRPRKVAPNLTKEERKALSYLIDLQKQNKVVITKCDKTGGFAIVDRSDYVDNISEMLEASLVDSEGVENKCYQLIDKDTVEKHHTDIKRIIKYGLNQELYNKRVADSLLPKEASCGRLYGLLKDHKCVQEGKKIPPMRLVISGSGSNTEYISRFLDFYIKPLVKKLPSYLEDTKDFLNSLKIFEENLIPIDVIPVSIDVVSLYGSIRPEDAMKSVKEALELRTTEMKDVMPTEFLMELLDLVLMCNTFEFNGNFYHQKEGIATGTVAAPSIANLDMGSRDKKILSTSNPHIKRIYKGYFKRFIDDIFFLFQGSEVELKSLLEYMNGLFPTIKFTMSYDYESRSVEYLDVKVTISDGKIITDLYRKPMSSNTYLENSSCHPKHVKLNIPYGIALRIKMICSEDYLFEKHVETLVEWLKEKNHDMKNTLEMIDKARKVDRKDLLKANEKIENEKSIFVYPYIPGIPSITKVLYDHKSYLDNDKELEKVFKDGFTVAYKRNKNLSELLCKAKLYPDHDKEVRNSDNGWNNCGKCLSCKHSFTSRKSVHFYSQNRNMTISAKLCCLDKNVVYVIECERCLIQYGGSTEQKYRLRCDQWRSDININSKLGQVIEHFNSKGHVLKRDFRMIPIERVHGDRDTLRIRERYYIDKYGLLESGLNTKRT